MTLNLTPVEDKHTVRRSHRHDYKKYVATGEINREELAWAAGFFDGEGNIGAHRANGKYWHLRMHVSQTELEPLDRFRAAVLGLGSIHLRQRESKSHYGSKPIYEYRTNAFQEVQAVMAMIGPFLSGPKRRQFIAAAKKAGERYAD
jgi:hypothetical protein